MGSYDCTRHYDEFAEDYDKLQHIEISEQLVVHHIASVIMREIREEHKETERTIGIAPFELPLLIGDFETYTDRNFDKIDKVVIDMLRNFKDKKYSCEGIPDGKYFASVARTFRVQLVKQIINDELNMKEVEKYSLYIIL